MTLMKKLNLMMNPSILQLLQNVYIVIRYFEAHCSDENTVAAVFEVKHAFQEIRRQKQRQPSILKYLKK